MKKILLITLAIMLTLPLRANAFSWGDFFRSLFGLSKEETVTEKTSVKEDIEKTLNEYINEALSIDKEVQSAFTSMVTIISGNSEVQTIKENLKKANNLKDRTEKVTALNKIYNDYSAKINNNKAEIIALLLLSTDKEKETLKNDINTIISASQKYLDLSKKNIQLAETTIKKATIEDERVILLNNINKVSEEFALSAKATTILSRQAKILATLAGIKF